jgi:uncharacterized protein (DUF302 family)
MGYYYAKKINIPYAQALELVNEKIEDVGFGVITEIDFKDKIKDKLGIDFRNYKILGACQPKFAYEAIKEDDRIGVMLPCNVVIQELDDQNTEVIVMNPSNVLAALNNKSIENLAKHVDLAMRNLIDSI